MKSLLKKTGLIAIALIICEIFIFNFASVITMNTKNEFKFDISEAIINDVEFLEEEGVFIVPPSSKASITFNDVNAEIDTLYIDSRFSTEDFIVSFSYSEETNTESRRTNGHIDLIKNNNYSQYALCSFSGEIKTIKFYFETEENTTFILNSIIANKRIPFNISIARFTSLFVFAVIIVLLSSYKPLKNKIEEKYTFKTAAFIVITLFVLLGLILSSYASNGLVSDFTEPKTNQINKELVDAFEAGQVHLLREAEEELLALENPYDWSQRLQAGVKYAWDHCLYNGHYYSYYGIAPVLLLFLPYHLLTGLYFPSVWAIFIFGTIGVVFLGMTYYEFIKKFYKKLPTNIAVMGLIIIELISGIWYCFPSNNFYEIAQSSGFAFTTLGAYFLITSNAISEGRLSRIKAAFSSIFLALSVLCRPTLAIYCIVALVFIFFGAKKAYIENKAKSVISYLCASLIPFIIIGSIQMIYNYLRFDSFFDFGIQYSLTINDFTKAEYHTPLAIIGFYNFLLAFPKISLQFPFINSNYSTLGVNGYYFTANREAIGVIFRALPVFSYLLAGKAYKLNNKNKKSAFLILTTCIIAPLIIIFSIWESGYGVRYCVDFYWQIVIGALAIAFYLYLKSSPSIKKVADKLMLFSVIVAFVTTFAQTYSYIYNGSNANFKAVMLSFGRLFEFWNIM